MNKLLAAPLAWLKAAQMRFAQSRWGWASLELGGSQYNYTRTFQSSQTNAIVAACIRFVCRTFPEAPLQVNTRDAEGELEEQLDHPLTTLLEAPNPFYSGIQLWNGTLSDLLLTGNAYWLKVRGGPRTAASQGQPVQLWWLPSTLVEPRWTADPTVFIDHYEYFVDGQLTNYDPKDIVHFRDGFDPRNMRKGLSPLASVVREVATDDEAAAYTAAMLRNVGVPGVIISPGPGATADDAALEDVKLKFEQSFGADNRGRALVMRGPTSVNVVAFSPEQMKTTEARRLPEERITAVFGTPAIVVGMGAGLDRSTFANFAEAREAAYESLIIPLQRQLLADLQLQLVADFADPKTLRLTFDYSAVRVLQADHNAIMDRAVKGWQAGLLTRAEARVLVDQEPGPADEVYQLASVNSWVPADEVPEPPAPAAPAAPADGTPAASPSAADGTPEPLAVAAGYALKAADPATVTDADLAAARARWDALAPAGLDGLLEARPRNGHAP